MAGSARVQGSAWLFMSVSSLGLLADQVVDLRVAEVGTAAVRSHAVETPSRPCALSANKVLLIVGKGRSARKTAPE